MTTLVIAANIIALIGCFFMVGVGYAKDNRTTIIMQTIQAFVLGISNLMLGSIPAVISNWGVIPRNYIVLKKKYTLPVKIAYTAALTVFGICTNNVGWLGVLPITATIMFSLSLDTENKKFLKLIIMITLVMWVIHDTSIQSYTTAIFSVITFFSSIIGYFRPERLERNKE